MAQFASDVFTGTPAAALVGTGATTGGTWTNGGGSASSPIFSGSGANVREASGLIAQCYLPVTPASADYSVQVDILTESGGSDSASGVIGRKTADSVGTFYLADYYDAPTAGSRQWRLYKFVSGTPTSLGSYTQNLGASATATVKLEMIGSAIKVYVGGVERISATDSSITAAGRAGIRQGNCALPGSNALFLDNFTADTSPKGVPGFRRRPTGLYLR